MSLLDKPVSMNELGKAVVEDIGAVSQRTLYQEKSDLSAVWESMYEKGLQRKVSTQCYFNPDELEIPDRHKTTQTEAGAELRTDINKNEPNCNVQGKKDLASVHLERALNTSRANWHNHGRHYRRRRTLSKDGDSKISEN